MAAAIGNHLVDIHVELCAAAGHPDMQREHVGMLAGKNLVADLHDQLVHRVVQPPARMVRVGRPLLQGGVGGDHLPRDQILADAEMFQRALGLGAPQLVDWNINLAKAISFFSHITHIPSYIF